MWYDADIDALMRRTRARPDPGGPLSRDDALAFGIVLGGFAVAVLGLAANWLAAALLAFTIFFYVVVYTAWLKRWTPQNIVIGGAAGALPPVIGWAAVTGTCRLEPLVFFLIIFMWTPPHFWALALFTRDDYARVGIPMMPNVAGDASTRRQILVYSVLLAPIGDRSLSARPCRPGLRRRGAALGAEFVRRASCCGGAETATRDRRRQAPLRLSISISSGSSRCGSSKRRRPAGCRWVDRMSADGSLTGAGEARRRRLGRARASLSALVVVLFYVMALIGPGVMPTCR